MKILKWQRKDKIDFFWGIFFGIITSTLSAFLPFLVKLSTDKFTEEQSNQTILFSSLLLAIMFILGAFSIMFSYYSKFFLARLTSRKIGQTRQKLFENIQKASPQDLQKYDSSSLISRLSIDIFNYSLYLNWSFINVIPSTLRLIVFSIMTFIINYYLGILMVVLSFILFIISYFFAKGSVFHYQKSIDSIDNITNITQENIIGIRVVKAFNLINKQIERFNKINNKIVEHASQADIRSLLPWPLSIALINSTSIIILIVASIANINFPNLKINYGDIVATISYSYLILWSTFDLIFLYIYHARSLTSKKRIYELLTIKFNSIVKNKNQFKNGDIVFKNVSFKYNALSHDYVLHNINLNLEKFSKIGIIGPTGSGKTSLVYLIAGMWLPTDGNIFINNVDLKEINTESLLSNVSIAFQNKQLFSGTIFENIKFANNELNENDVYELLEICEMKKFIESKKEGLNYLLEEFGQNLSGGQKQRLNIARALAKKAKIYIFDDSTSALDNITEKKILDRIFKYKKNSTLIISSQKVSTVKNMDLIIVLDKGEVSGIGTHEDLLKHNPIYQEIFKLQNK